MRLEIKLFRELYSHISNRRYLTLISHGGRISEANSDETKFETNWITRNMNKLQKILMI